LRVSNRTIWTLWLQGFADAPPLVQACLESWRRFNPGWRVQPLDQHSLGDVIDLVSLRDASGHLTLQKTSALARLALLRRYGGVWTDATVFCLRPLDDWIDPAFGAGFFAFKNPAKDRMLANWFIAAEPDNTLLVALHDAFVEFLTRRTFANQNNAFGRAALKKLVPILSRSFQRTTLWLNPALQAVVRAYPYYIFHYTFNKLILTRPELRAIWERVPAIEARPLHSLQKYAKQPDRLADALAGLEREDWPLQKLDWRVDLTSPYWRPVMNRLVDALPQETLTHRGAAQ
jgi:capsular polysaccharide synthesis protein